MDPDLEIDIITELDLVNTTIGVTQVSGLHNASKAFLFQDVEREIHAAPDVSEKLIQLLRNKSEFTFLAILKQRALTSGVILSIREQEHSYFELESSGLRDEIRYQYRFNGKSRTEVFPYRMADWQWHKIALSLSASHLLLHVDCNRIYERVIDPPETNLTPGSNLWLGQRNRKHGFFKGIIQDVKVIFMPNGYIAQCPNLNRTCPTCSDFLSLVQGIMDLQELLAKMTAKLNYAETRLSQLENCHCEKTCQVNGVIYLDKDSWVEDDHCRNCTCKSGVVECRRMSCPPLNCSPDALPVHVADQCCRVCRPKCIYGGKVLAEGQRILTKTCRECRNGVLVKVTETCPPLNCSEKDHILPENQCCGVCRGHNFCAEGHRCGENSECKNWNTKATCECKNGYVSAQGDSVTMEQSIPCCSLPAPDSKRLHSPKPTRLIVAKGPVLQKLVQSFFKPSYSTGFGCILTCGGSGRGEGDGAARRSWWPGKELGRILSPDMHERSRSRSPFAGALFPAAGSSALLCLPQCSFDHIFWQQIPQL
uniref:VWFC domain-containing protein n=1 Tax=Sphenodon punctatus TaxID=8508 RepID=A0A8D0H311_SPHPU